MRLPELANNFLVIIHDNLPQINTLYKIKHQRDVSKVFWQFSDRYEVSIRSSRFVGTRHGKPVTCRSQRVTGRMTRASDAPTVATVFNVVSNEGKDAILISAQADLMNDVMGSCIRIVISR